LGFGIWDLGFECQLTINPKSQIQNPKSKDSTSVRVFGFGNAAKLLVACFETSNLRANSNKMKKFFFVSIFGLSLLAVGCQTQSVNTNQAEQTKPANQSAAAANENDAQDFTVEFKASPAQPAVEEQVELTFVVKNPNGEIVKNLPAAHEKPMHLIVVSEDLAEFFHLHPEAQPDGSYKSMFAFKNGGKYKLYADLAPVGDKPLVRIFDLTVAGGSDRAKEELKPDEKFEKTVEDLRVVMKPEGELTAGQDVLLTYNVFDARTNRPAADLQKYLGETAHFVVINRELNEFVHAHPAAGGGEHKHGDHSNHGSSEKNAAPNSASTVSARVTFPKAGIYKIWAEVQRGGKVTAIPFVVSVKPGAEEKPIEEAKIPADAVLIKVSREGFTPEEVTAEKGRPLKLAFHRTDEINCGDQIVFPELNIKRNLPAGEVVIIDLPTAEAKTFKFACGMDMLRGKIVVQ
jgi:hypothetical protein